VFEGQLNNTNEFKTSSGRSRHRNAGEVIRWFYFANIPTRDIAAGSLTVSDHHHTLLATQGDHRGGVRTEITRCGLRQL
jgi:hypothetical protein